MGLGDGGGVRWGRGPSGHILRTVLPPGGQSQNCSLVPQPSPLLFSRSAVSHSLQPHGLQHSRLPCPSPSPRTCTNSCPLSQSCHPTISFSVIPFSSCPLSFPVSGSVVMSLFIRCSKCVMLVQLHSRKY